MTRETAITPALLRNTADNIHSRGPAICAEQLRQAATRIAQLEAQWELFEKAQSRLTAALANPRWYSVDPCEYLQERDSPSEARDVAASALEPDGEWPEDVESTEWGLLVPFEHAVQTDRREDPDGVYDYIANYVLAPVVKETT